MRVGTSIFFRSSVVSVSENASIQSYALLMPTRHRLQPELIPLALRHRRARAVRAVEGGRQVLVELRPVVQDTSPNIIKDLHRQSVGIRLGLQHQRRDRAEEHGLTHSRRSVPAHVSGDLATAGRVPDQYYVL